jgi:hypothetical protein
MLPFVYGTRYDRDKDEKGLSVGVLLLSESYVHPGMVFYPDWKYSIYDSYPVNGRLSHKCFFFDTGVI